MLCNAASKIREIQLPNLRSIFLCLWSDNDTLLLQHCDSDKGFLVSHPTNMCRRNRVTQRDVRATQSI
jgi:hypothetical protein